MIRINETVVLEVIGEIDVSTAPALRTALELVGEVVVVDLTRVEFICSSGLGVLMAAHRRLHARGGSLAVVADPAGPVRRLLDFVGVEFRPLYGSVAEALEAARDDTGPPG